MPQVFCHSATALTPLLNVTSSIVPNSIDLIYKKIWALSPQVQCAEAYRELVRLTKELTKIYESQGRLKINPFASTRERKINLHSENIFNELKGSVCLVTGGRGCVGSVLIKELLKFKVKTIVILDNNISDTKSIYPEGVVNEYCDIRILQNVHKVFSLYAPDYVFHTAAQRDPGLAETRIAETVTTNVLGTLNIVKACEAVGSVKQMVYASTGKSSRYFTEEVYAATKKMGEFIVDTFARESAIKYSMVRFTHILDNSLMNIELKDDSASVEYLSIHSPGKYVTAQNAKEAAYLMLNAILYSESEQCNLLLVRYLDWPVESLEVALYYIKESQRDIPIVFVGNPIGYSEKFFRGQLDWSIPSEINLLTNVYERKHKRLTNDEDIIILRTCPTDKDTLERVLENVLNAKGEKETKVVLTQGLKEMVRESLKLVDKEETADILRWGLDPKFLEMEHINVTDFNPLISLLVESLAGSEYDKETEEQSYQIA